MISTEFYRSNAPEPQISRRKCIICNRTTQIPAEWIMWFLCISLKMPSDISYLIISALMIDPHSKSRTDFDYLGQINHATPVMYVINNVPLEYMGKTKTFEFVRNRKTHKTSKVLVKSSRSTASAWVCRYSECAWNYSQTTLLPIYGSKKALMLPHY
jgi:hypothetical protein